ncbi:galectin-8 [Stomoxys calcitrans]|uniref:Galectin n=1 Tax=Stomoxys calcitrans TaxID=35570 RepID=A0A1I8PVA7_STOCA|nr:galectin-8 [Stomoxys calcitrans]
MENFTTEFNGTLSHHLDRGQYFEIELQTIENAKKFHISLAKEKLNKNQDADIAMYLLVNIADKKISANSRYGGDWINAIEAECDISDALKQPLKITIHLWEESFNVAINGDHKIRLYYCGNIHLVQAIQIEDDIKRITRIDHRNTYPKPWPLWCRVHHSALGETNYFSSDVPRAPHQGLMVVIRVRCYGEMGRLNINTKHEERGKLFAHFCIRFDQNLVICNSMQDGLYDQEERANSFPFDFSRDFRIGIACGEKAFLLAVNGTNLCTFAYRDWEECQLSTVGGFNMTSTHGLQFKVTEFDYVQLNGPECKNFEMQTMN